MEKYMSKLDEDYQRKEELSWLLQEANEQDRKYDEDGLLIVEEDEDPFEGSLSDYGLSMRDFL